MPYCRTGLTGEQHFVGFGEDEPNLRADYRLLFFCHLNVDNKSRGAALYIPTETMGTRTSCLWHGLKPVPGSIREHVPHAYIPLFHHSGLFLLSFPVFGLHFILHP